ncbi:class I SAM-dependent methyltransferase [Candidatus Methanoprimaticola sp. MG2]|uniref:class I SAM-dependent methyltransferase n=1 Tax=Candidatus Methanoprimaticola sp. MG2 TaxID=3228838 RepID=UPI0039C63B12
MNEQTIWDSRAKDFAKLPIPDWRSDALLMCIGRTHTGGYGSALDIGCGAGQVSIALSLRFSSVTGLDISPAMIHEAKRLAESEGVPNAEFMSSDWNSDGWRGGLDRSYDLILANMTPAIISQSSLDRMCQLCTGTCYVVIGTDSMDPHMDAVCEMLEVERRCTESPPILDLLERMGHDPSVETWDAEKRMSRSVEEIASFYRARLFPDGTDEETDVRIHGYFQSKSVNGRVEERIPFKKNAIWWRP